MSDSLHAGDIVTLFELVSPIGNGGFGCVWKVRSTEDDKFYAMKLEKRDALRKTLGFECNVYKRLAQSERFPQFIHQGSYQNYNYCVIELLGPNLYQVARALPGGHIVPSFLPDLADQMLSCIEEFHKRGFIHRDIKPENFSVRLQGKTPICLLDFGVSRLYVDQRGRHIKPREHVAAIGSPTYSSPNITDHIELSRRDDLYSFIYTILALSPFSLPWANQPNYQDVVDMKKKYFISELCMPLGEGFVEAAIHIEELKFAETPDYAYLHECIQKEIQPNGVPFEWNAIQPEGATKAVGGNLDPTGFLLSLAPYIDAAEQKKMCNLI